MTKQGVAALLLAGALALPATSASAQWRGWGPGLGVGIAMGALVGAAIMARPYYGGYGGYYAAPGYGYYAAPAYSYAPPATYVVPAPAYGYAAPAYGYAAGYYGVPAYGFYDDTRSRSWSRNGYFRSNCGGSYGQGRGCAEGDTTR